MKFLNSMDIEFLCVQYGRNPSNVGRAVRLLAAVQNHADANSDGWAYWPLPCRASKKLMELIERPLTPTDAELRKAAAPIRAFYTRIRSKVPTYPSFPEHTLS